jgi:hypothetical protein
MNKISAHELDINRDVESQQNIVPINTRTYCEIITLFWIMVLIIIFVFLVISRLLI